MELIYSFFFRSNKPNCDFFFFLTAGVFAVFTDFFFATLSFCFDAAGVTSFTLATLLFCYINKINSWHFADLLTPAIPLGYTFGRLGNFLNGELFGRVTNVPWGMYFPLDPTSQLRHPSQLYEAFFEGIVLFVILWSVRKKRLFNGFHFCLYIIGYGIVRFSIAGISK